MLEFQEVTKKFEKVTAVNHVSFKVETGRVLGIVGRNGAGKSTIFRMILNLIEPTSGNIRYDGQKINGEIMNRFGYMPEEGSVIPSYSVLDVAEYYGALKLMKKEEIDQKLLQWLESFHITEYLTMKVKNLSKGNKQKIQFILSILHDPDFIILDEPFSGLDPVSVAEMEREILKLKEQGKTIIFSSHVMNHVENICDDILMMHHGEAILQGDLKEILATYTIQGEKASSLNQIFIDKAGENCE